MLEGVSPENSFGPPSCFGAPTHFDQGKRRTIPRLRVPAAVEFAVSAQRVLNPLRTADTTASESFASTAAAL